MRRREFIAGLAGSAAWPLATRAQRRPALRRIGMLMPLVVDDPESQARMAAYLQTLAQLGWIVGSNLQIDIRWTGASESAIRKHAAELAALAPELIVGAGSAAVGPLLQVTRTIPIVFVTVPDPVGAGYVDSMARPGGNATGFINFEYSIGVKWLELLKEIAPRTTRVAVLRDATLAVGTGQFGAIQGVASSLGVELRPIDVRDAGEMER